MGNNDRTTRATEGFAVRATETDNEVLVALEGEIDLAAEETVATALGEAVLSGRHVVVDLDKVTFIDSTGLRTLVRAAMMIRDRDGTNVAVRNVNSRVAQLFSLTGLDETFDVV